MAIPDNIAARHILKAISTINKEGTPRLRNSYKYFVSCDSRLYPPKYLISLANLFANGELLNPNPKIFNTYMAQAYLTDLGFKVITKKNSKKNAQA